MSKRVLPADSFCSEPAMSEETNRSRAPTPEGSRQTTPPNPVTGSRGTDGPDISPSVHKQYAENDVFNAELNGWAIRHTATRGNQLNIFSISGYGMITTPDVSNVADHRLTIDD